MVSLQPKVAEVVEYSDKKWSLEKLLDETVVLWQFVVLVVLEVLDHDWNW